MRASRYTPPVRQGKTLEFGHLIAFIAVAVVLNAQYTWWIYSSLRDNGERLDLQRSLRIAQVQGAAFRLNAELDAAQRVVLAQAPGVIPAVVPPFTEVRVDPDPGNTTAVGWQRVNDQICLVRPLRRGWRLIAVLDGQAPYHVLAEVAPDLQLVDAGQTGDQRPHVVLAPPLDQLAVTSDLKSWQELLGRHRRRVVLVLAEGGLLLAAMITVVALMWRVLRRESALEHQHQSFVSAVTHELKTPIAGIRLALETVIAGRTDDEGRRRFLGNALTDVERLANLVEKILEVTRYTGGSHRLDIAVGDLSMLVEEEVGVAQRRAAPRGAVLKAEVLPGVQASFDPEALAIVLSNLVENALKYAQGDPPRVWVRVRVERGDAIIEVKDNGIGIAAIELDAIFKPFYRAGDDVTRRTPGTGIGLFVAREIVAAHGGRLTATSDGRGKGATFRIVLPGAELLPEEGF